MQRDHGGQHNPITQYTIPWFRAFLLNPLSAKMIPEQFWKFSAITYEV